MQVCIIGLGYVGLPLAVEFSKKGIKVIGYDIDKQKIEMLKKGIDPSGQISKEELKLTDIKYTTKIEDAKGSNYFIICVPTPINKYKEPNLKPIISAAKDIAKIIEKDNIVILESTVYPGVTEEILGKTIEKESKMKVYKDFKLAYSPERINPGDKKHTLKNTIKVIGAQDKETAEKVKKLYELIIEKTYVAKDIKTAEASKLIENVQRSVNIGLMNELALLFDRLEINIWEVLEAAKTKWNFIDVRPGLVGGHCIPIDPYYLLYLAKKVDFHSYTVSASRIISDDMHRYLAIKTLKKMNELGSNLKDKEMLFLGITYKENVPDTRSSMALKLIEEFKKLGAKITIVDPLIEKEGVLKEIPDKKFDVVVLAVKHKEFLDKKEEIIKKTKILLVDINNIFKDYKGNRILI